VANNRNAKNAKNEGIFETPIGKYTILYRGFQKCLHFWHFWHFYY
jgi:hypothetical protein